MTQKVQCAYDERCSNTLFAGPHFISVSSIFQSDIVLLSDDPLWVATSIQITRIHRVSVAHLAPTSFSNVRIYAGLRAQEFFLHAVVGREGWTYKAVKTAETGYIRPRLEGRSKLCYHRRRFCFVESFFAIPMKRSSPALSTVTLAPLAGA